MPSKNDLSALKKPTLVSSDSQEADKPILDPAKGKKRRVARINKGLQIEEGRAAMWDLLVARLKSAGANKKTGPQLADEAMDLLFERYQDQLATQDGSPSLSAVKRDS